MPYATTRAGRTYFAERGDGPPVVLLHATLHDHADYDPVAGRLAASYRTIAVDWPGHGRSDPPPDGVRCGAELFAGVLADLVDELALAPAAVVGNSVGGYAAARLAIDRPHRVAALVSVNGAGFIRMTAVGRAFCRLLGTRALARRLMPAMVPRYMRPRTEFDTEITRAVAARARTEAGASVTAQLWRSFAEPGYDLRARAGEITAPTLLVWGTRDVVLPLRAGRQTHRVLPGSRLDVLDTGHVVFASDPEGFLASVEPFLDAAFRPGAERAIDAPRLP